MQKIKDKEIIIILKLRKKYSFTTCQNDKLRSLITLYKYLMNSTVS